jgi:hypothetical protein
MRFNRPSTPTYHTTPTQNQTILGKNVYEISGQKSVHPVHSQRNTLHRHFYAHCIVINDIHCLENNYGVNLDSCIRLQSGLTPGILSKSRERQICNQYTILLYKGRVNRSVAQCIWLQKA